jgi:hypothetical protein
MRARPVDLHGLSQALQALTLDDPEFSDAVGALIPQGEDEPPAEVRFPPEALQCNQLRTPAEPSPWPVAELVPNLETEHPPRSYRCVTRICSITCTHLMHCLPSN